MLVREVSSLASISRENFHLQQVFGMFLLIQVFVKLPLCRTPS
jgi:hypothetical protein